MVEERAVRILLECILVVNAYCTKKSARCKQILILNKIIVSATQCSCKVTRQCGLAGVGIGPCEQGIRNGSRVLLTDVRARHHLLPDGLQRYLASFRNLVQFPPRLLDGRLGQVPPILGHHGRHHGHMADHKQSLLSALPRLRRKVSIFHVCVISAILFRVPI